MRGTNDDHGKKNFTTMDDALIRQQPVTGIGLRRLAQLLRTKSRGGQEPSHRTWRFAGHWRRKRCGHRQANDPLHG
jgi:hypothetical protein